MKQKSIRLLSVLESSCGVSAQDRRAVTKRKAEVEIPKSTTTAQTQYDEGGNDCRPLRPKNTIDSQKSQVFWRTQKWK